MSNHPLMSGNVFITVPEIAALSWSFLAHWWSSPFKFMTENAPVYFDCKTLVISTAGYIRTDKKKALKLNLLRINPHSIIRLDSRGPVKANLWCKEAPREDQRSFGWFPGTDRGLYPLIRRSSPTRCWGSCWPSSRLPSAPPDLPGSWQPSSGSC